MPETEVPAVAVDAPVVAANPAKDKKPMVPKEKKPREAKSAPSHPPYFRMINEAISSLREKNGSSAYAIAKYMESKHKDALPANYKKILGLQLKNAAAKGKLIKVKASFKLAVVNLPKKAPPTPAKKPSKPKLKPKTATKKAPFVAAKPAKKPAAKKTPKKKASAPKPKSIRSGKSPAAKKVRKVV